MPFLILTLVAMAVLIGLAFYFEHLRKEMWRKLAQKYGLQYDAGDPLDLRAQYEFNLFRQGHSKKVRNTLQGQTRGMDVVLFDYRYTTGSGKNSRTHQYSALMVKLPVAGELHIRPETFLDRIAEMFGWADIDFELDQFNRAFRVTGPDKKFAYDICHPRMMEYLLGHPSHCWEIHQDRLLLYSSTLGQFDESEVESCLCDARAFLDLLPAYLLQK